MTQKTVIERMNELFFLEKEIREVKSVLRSPWGDKRLWREQHRLEKLKREATIAYVLIAHCRGKQHLQDKEKNAQIVDTYWVERTSKPVTETACV